MSFSDVLLQQVATGAGHDDYGDETDSPPEPQPEYHGDDVPKAAPAVEIVHEVEPERSSIPSSSVPVQRDVVAPVVVPKERPHIVEPPSRADEYAERIRQRMAEMDEKLRELERAEDNEVSKVHYALESLKEDGLDRSCVGVPRLAFDSRGPFPPLDNLMLQRVLMYVLALSPHNVPFVPFVPFCVCRSGGSPCVEEMNDLKTCLGAKSIDECANFMRALNKCTKDGSGT